MKNIHTGFDDHDIYEMGFELKRSTSTHVKGRITVVEIISINYDEADETYCVGNLDGPDQQGVDKDKNKAILKYLAVRLGVDWDEK